MVTGSLMELVTEASEGRNDETAIISQYEDDIPCPGKM
jgi:hypothetical protein